MMTADKPLSMNAALTDSDAPFLLEARTGGQRAAFENLLWKYYKRIFNFIYRSGFAYDQAEALTQAVFVRAYKTNLQSLARTPFRVLLYTIARRTIVHARRYRKGLPSAGEDVSSQNRTWMPHFAEHPCAKALSDVRLKELALAVPETVAQLPEPQRVVVLLRRYENLSFEEIAAIMGSSVAHVKAQLAQARKSVRFRLHEFIS